VKQIKVKEKCYSLLAQPFHVKLYNSKLCQVKIFKINPFIRAAHERLRGTLQISECVMPKVSFHVLESISREFMSGLKGKQRRLLDASGAADCWREREIKGSFLQ
jgi:hypothetical protein